ncbi:MAG: wax ester/triacylglycerol synthase family O-acyltransferase [Stenotrophobium sp.]
MNKALNPLERSWLMLESPATPAHFGALLTFSLPAAAPRGYVGQLVERLRAECACVAPWNLRLNRKLRFLPRWEEEQQPDMEYHVRHSAMPAPGGERELGVLVSRLHSHPLDMSRPLWECHLIEGLHDGQYAIYFKMHHALTDVASLLRMLTAWLSADPQQREAPAPWTLTSTASELHSAGERLQASMRSFIQRGEVVSSATDLGRAFTRLLRKGTKKDSALRAPYRAPHSALNVRIDAQRRFATQQYQRARLQRVAEACAISLDELVLYLCGSALRRFFKEYNALPEQPFIAALPGLRKGQDGEAGEAPYGSIAFVSLGTQFADPHKRMTEVHRSVQASREHLDAVPESMIPLYTLLTATPYLLSQVSGVRRLLPAMFSLVIADQAGPEQLLYCNGAELKSLYPMFPLLQGAALSITCLHYADTLNIGICGARETLPSLQRMAVYMGQALADLEEALTEGAAS